MTVTWAHEIKTPLAAARHRLRVLGGLLDELGESLGHPGVTDRERRQILAEARDVFRAAAAGTDRAARCLRRAQQPADGSPQRTALAARVGSLVELLEPRATAARARIEAVGLEGLHLYVDPLALDLVLTNLVLNSLQAIAQGGGSRVEVRAHVMGDRLVVVVQDDGPGIAPQIRDRLFVPGATTRPGTGTGSGLPNARRLASSMGASLVFLDTPDRPRGACFELSFSGGGGVAARPAGRFAVKDRSEALLLRHQDGGSAAGTSPRMGRKRPEEGP